MKDASCAQSRATALPMSAGVAMRAADRKPEGGPLARGALKADLPAHQFGELLADRRTETGPGAADFLDAGIHCLNTDFQMKKVKHGAWPHKEPIKKHEDGNGT